MVLVDIDALITTVLAIDSGWTSRFKRVNHSGLVHMYVCRKSTSVSNVHKNFFFETFSDICFEVKCHSTNYII